MQQPAAIIALLCFKQRLSRSHQNGRGPGCERRGQQSLDRRALTPVAQQRYHGGAPTLLVQGFARLARGPDFGGVCSRQHGALAQRRRLPVHLHGCGMRSLQQSHRPERLLCGQDGKLGIRMRLRATSPVGARRCEQRKVQRQRSGGQCRVQQGALVLTRRRFISHDPRRASSGERVSVEQFLRIVRDVRAQHRGQPVCAVGAQDAPAILASRVGCKQREARHGRVRQIPARVPVGRQVRQSSLRMCECGAKAAPGVRRGVACAARGD